MKCQAIGVGLTNYNSYNRCFADLNSSMEPYCCCYQRALPILVFADIADTDTFFTDTSTDIADTDILLVDNNNIDPKISASLYRRNMTICIHIHRFNTSYNTNKHKATH